MSVVEDFDFYLVGLVCGEDWYMFFVMKVMELVIVGWIIVGWIIVVSGGV